MSKFVICISSDNPESLVIGKVYRTLPDAEAAKHRLVRVIDETYGEPGSEDGYLYSASRFVPIELPELARQVLMTTDERVQQDYERIPNPRTPL